MVVKPGQVPLATSSFRSVRLSARNTPRFSLVWFNGLTDLYIFIEALAFYTLAHTISTIVRYDVGVVIELFTTRHISLIPFAFGTKRCRFLASPPSSTEIPLHSDSYVLQGGCFRFYSFLQLVVDRFCHPTPSNHSYRLQCNVFLGCLKQDCTHTSRLASAYCSHTHEISDLQLCW